VNWRVFGRNRLWPNLGKSAVSWIEESEKSRKFQDSRCLCRNSNQATPEYKSRVLPLHLPTWSNEDLKRRKCMKVRYTCICCLGCVRYTFSGLLRLCGLVYCYQSISRVRRSLVLRCVTLKMKVLPFTIRHRVSPQRFCLRQRGYENLTSCIG